jgi:hypothetical protein
MINRLSDILQIAIQIPGINYVVYFAAFYLLFSAIKTAGNMVRSARWLAGKVFVKPSLWYAVFTGILTIFAVQYTQTISDYLQYWETKSEAVQQYNGFGTSKTVAIFEAELRRNTLPEEYNLIIDSLQAWRLEFGMDSTAAYECMICECALNPFIVRKDGIAAGPIQFTSNGCKGLGFDLSTVKKWCEQRDAKSLMMATGAYLRSRAKGKAIKTGLDFYITVFAPGFLGCKPDQVLYDSGNAYYLNRGMDGFCIQNGIVVRSPAAINGNITVNDVNLWMRFKTGQLVKKSLKFK